MLADSAVEDHNRGLVEQEPQLTDRWLGRIAESLQGYRVKGVTWTAKTLTDRGSGAQERQYGPDFIGVLDIDLPEYKVKKGFLAQAKLLKNGYLNTSEFNRMRHQCEQMLALSPDSFVFLYSRDGIRVVPAIAVVSAAAPEVVFEPDALYSRKISRFYEEHLECFIGDRSINEPSVEMLSRLHSRSLLHFAARQSEEK